MPRQSNSRARLNAADRRVAARLRERRLLLGLTQSQVASAIGCSYQQYYKYETGRCGISIGLLADLARALDVTPDWLLEGLPAASDVPAPDARLRCISTLTHAFLAIPSDRTREQLLLLVRTLATQQPAAVPLAEAV